MVATSRPDPALVVIAGGVCAALHIGKLAPAIAPLQQALGLTLVQAGFLLSLVQGAGMLAGVGFGVVADGLGARRSMVLGLLVMAVASAAGGAAPGVPVLMAARAAEGFGFLLVVLPAPGLVRALVPPARASSAMGLWGAYMPLATATALLLGPWCIATAGWRAWWWALAALSAAMAGVLLRVVPPTPRPPPSPWLARLRRTLAVPGPWLVAATFSVYSGQWLAVIGFLPTVYQQAGIAATTGGALTAGVALANMVGNVAAGRLLQRSVHPGRLLGTGFAVMALAAAATFAGDPGLPAAARYAAVLLFSGVGGLVPATLFAMAVRVAPGADTLSTTVGWVQQWSAAGQFLGPPLVAWVASRSGGWQHTWWVTASCCVAGAVLSALLLRGLDTAGSPGSSAGPPRR